MGREFGFSTIRTQIRAWLVETSYDQQLMIFDRADFVPFSGDAGRVAANLEAAYDQWLDARQQLAAMPVSMYWQPKASGDYLAVKQQSSSSGTTVGPRSEQTEAKLTEFTRRR